LILSLLPALALGITSFANCDGDPSLGCFADTECTAPAKCAADAAGTPPAGGAMGCCLGAATTTTTAATTAASCVDKLNPLTGVSDCPARASLCTNSAYLDGMRTCVDKLNPVTGVSDCPARASLCTNSVYLDVMRIQCPSTCGFCTSG
ncbi:hypothetical protein PMAYCL1PPCAC_17290, partial [Pristionchus mayeri]